MIAFGFQLAYVIWLISDVLFMTKLILWRPFCYNLRMANARRRASAASGARLCRYSTTQSLRDPTCMWYSSYWRHAPRSGIGDLSLRESHVEGKVLGGSRLMTMSVFKFGRDGFEVKDMWGLWYLWSWRGGLDVCVRWCIIYRCIYIYIYMYTYVCVCV